MTGRDLAGRRVSLVSGNTKNVQRSNRSPATLGKKAPEMMYGIEVRTFGHSADNGRWLAVERGERRGDRGIANIARIRDWARKSQSQEPPAPA